MQFIREYENTASYAGDPMVGPGVALIKDIKSVKYITELLDFTIDGKFHRGVGYWYYWIDSPHNSLGLTRKTSNNTIVLETGHGTYILNLKSGSTLTNVKPGTIQNVEGGANTISNGDSIQLNGVYILVLDESTSSAPAT